MATLWKQALLKFLSDANEQSLRSTLRSDWIGFYPEEKQEIFSFLYLTQQYKLFLYFFAIDLQSHIFILPWNHFMAIMVDENIPFQPSFFEELKKCLYHERLISSKASNLEELIQSFQERAEKKFLTRAAKFKQELISSARIAQSEQLMDQYLHYMKELKKMDPSQYNVEGLISENEKQKASQTLQKHGPQKISSQALQKNEHSKDLKSFVQLLKPVAEDYLKKKKALASDFAFLFRSLGDQDTAIEFIQSSEDSDQKSWQLLDYLFNGKQYVALLDHCLQMKSEYSQWPDALFSISYAEAIAYWELGERDKARHIMNQVASMRPQFKSAVEILSQWNEEQFE